MTDSGKQETRSSVTTEWELKLAREVRELDMDMQPSRNLWAGIERQIEAYPQPKKTSGASGANVTWMRYGIAASVLMAFSALVLSITDITGVMPQDERVAFDPNGSAAIDTLQVEYLKTRDPLVERFTETNRNLAPETLEELYRNIEIMAQARRDIEEQVRKDPTNPRLVELLMRVHEQELELLKQDFSQPSRSM